MREDVDYRTNQLIRQSRLLDVEDPYGNEFYAYVFAINVGLPSREIHLAINMKSLPDPRNKESLSNFTISKDTDNYYEILQIIADKLSTDYLGGLKILEPIKIRRRNNPPNWWNKYEDDEEDRKRKSTKSKIIRKIPKKIIKKCKCGR